MLVAMVSRPGPVAVAIKDKAAVVEVSTHLISNLCNILLTNLSALRPTVA
jgi:hypothetical protein